jgi:small subunit ribosomal protein S21
MLIIDSKDCENIDKALKKYKKKFEKSRVLLHLRERQCFTKPSINRRTEVPTHLIYFPMDIVLINFVHRIFYEYNAPNIYQ